jgi:release factor glutamine methyltransferase
MTLHDALLEASTLIARRDAETLLAHTLHRDRAWLLAHTEDDLSPKDLESFRALVTRRAAQEPLQHITGTQEFFGLTLRVTPDVLIPRPETEHLVEAVLNWAHTQSDVDFKSAAKRDTPHADSSRPLRIVDVGTGSGAIAIALASALPHASLTAIDISPAALAVAYANATGVPADRASPVGWKAGRLHLADRIRFLQGDLLTPLLTSRPSEDDPLFTGDPLAPLFAGSDPFDPTFAGRSAGFAFDVVVANPPYVALSEAATLAPEVRDHEPPLALFAGPDGLEIYRRLIPQAFDLLRPGGLLALEIGFGQRQSLSDLLTGWNDVRFLDDYASIPRVVLALRP